MPDMLQKRLQSSYCVKPMAVPVYAVCRPLLVLRGKICHHLALPGTPCFSAVFCWVAAVDNSSSDRKSIIVAVNCYKGSMRGKLPRLH